MKTMLKMFVIVKYLDFWSITPTTQSRDRLNPHWRLFGREMGHYPLDKTLHKIKAHNVRARGGAGPGWVGAGGQDCSIRGLAMEKGGRRCWAGRLHAPGLPAATGQGRALAGPLPLGVDQP